MIEITITNNAVAEGKTSCICTQGGFPAWDKCHVCKGTGFMLSLEPSPWVATLSNDNFDAIMNAIGFSSLPSEGDMDPGEFLVAMAAFCDPEKAVRGDLDHGYGGCYNLIECGLSRAAVTRRIDAIRRIAEEAERRGEQITWH